MPKYLPALEQNAQNELKAFNEGARGRDSGGRVLPGLVPFQQTNEAEKRASQERQAQQAQRAHDAYDKQHPYASRERDKPTPKAPEAYEPDRYKWAVPRTLRVLPMLGESAPLALSGATRGATLGSGPTRFTTPTVEGMRETAKDGSMTVNQVQQTMRQGKATPVERDAVSEALLGHNSSRIDLDDLDRRISDNALKLDVEDTNRGNRYEDYDQSGRVIRHNNAQEVGVDDPLMMQAVRDVLDSWSNQIQFDELTSPQGTEYVRVTTPDGASRNVPDMEMAEEYADEWLSQERRANSDAVDERYRELLMGRWGGAPAEPVTRVYRSEVNHNLDNHFDDDAYVAHTRYQDLDDGRVRQVVEIQSDLFQKNPKDRIVSAGNKGSQSITINDAPDWLLEGGEFDGERYLALNNGDALETLGWDVVDKLSSNAQDRAKILKLVDRNERVHIGDRLLTARRLVDRMQERGQNNIPTTLQRDVEAIAESVGAARVGRTTLDDYKVTDEIRQEVFDLLGVSIKNEQNPLTDKLGSMRKRWHERVLQEEVARAAEDGVEAVRFPTVETASEVEGWHKNVPEVFDSQRQFQDDYRKVVDGTVEELKPRDISVNQFDASPAIYDGELRPRFQTIVDRVREKDPEIADALEMAAREPDLRESTLSMDPNARGPYSIREVINHVRWHADDYIGTGRYEQKSLTIPERAEKAGYGTLVKFYRDSVPKYLKERYGNAVKQITDDQGDTWWEVDVTKIDPGKVQIRATSGFPLPLRKKRKNRKE